MKQFLVLACLMFFATSTLAQKRFEAGIMAIPSLTEWHTGVEYVSYEPTFQFNYGIGVSLQNKRLLFSSGIMHLNHTVKTEWLETSIEQPDGTGETFDVYMRAKTLVLPLKANYIFASTKRTDFFAGAGFYLGYIYSQQQENTSIPGDYAYDSLTLNTGERLPIHPPQYRFTDLDVFEDFYLGVNLGIGIRQSLWDNFSLHLRPNFLYQLRKELPKKTNAWTNRQMSYGLEVGIFYTFD